MSDGAWTFVTERDPLAQVARIQVVVRSGSVSDPEGLPGLASFTGRALLRGTRARPYAQLTESIERLGASVGVRTDQDTTIVSGSVLVRNFEPFLELLRDMLAQPAFDDAELATLATTLQGELRASLQDAQELGSRAALRAAYAGTAAERVPEGTVEGIGRAKPGDLRRFFESRYGTRNMIVGIVSPFDDAEARVKARLSGLPEGKLDDAGVPEPSLQGRRAVIVHEEGLSTTPLYVAVPGIGDADPESAELELGNFVFGGDFTSRLMQVLRAENGWTYGVSSGYRQIVGSKASRGLFSIYLFPSAEFAAQAVPVTLGMLEEYSAAGLSAAEFDKAREALGNAYPFQVATAEQRLSLRIRQLLTGRPYLGAEAYSARLAAMTPESVNAVIARRARPEPLLVVAVGDAAQLKPVLSALPGMQSVEVYDTMEA